jgi:hypothetical protein
MHIYTNAYIHTHKYMDMTSKPLMRDCSVRRESTTSACGLKLLVHEALSYQCMRP